MNEPTGWEVQCDRAATDFGRRCRDLHKSNPHEGVALDQIINTLTTELWDNGFSQTEIRSAFEQALEDMPRCATGTRTQR